MELHPNKILKKTKAEGRGTTMKTNEVEVEILFLSLLKKPLMTNQASTMIKLYC